MKLLGTDGGGRPEPVPLDQPGRVVGLAEVEQCETEFLDGVEGPHPKEIFLQGADEAFGAAIPLRRPDEGRRAVDAEEAQLLLEGVGHVLPAVVVAEGEAAGDPLAECPEAAAHALADRLAGPEAGGPPRRGGAPPPR